MIYVGIGTAAILGGVLLYFVYQWGYHMGRSSVLEQGGSLSRGYE